jgi:lipoprotein-releasing system permease protein
VERETVLVVGILCFISFTASFLILAIFWAMVSEKTRDIGVLRSLGATRLDIALIWLLYGAAIGLLGSGLGVALAYVVVLNINPIHDVLVSLGAGVWDPRVYYFTEIPSRVETSKAVLVGSMGVGFSLLGALVPALRAALLHPVRALRFE